LIHQLGAGVRLPDPDRECEARDIAVLAADAVERGAVLAPDQAVPVYLRNRVTAVGAS
jgi:hypothetical protein